MPIRRAYTTEYITLAALLVIAFAIQVRLSADLLEELFEPSRGAGFVLGVEDGTDRVSHLSPEARAAGLQAGDQIRSYDGHAFRGEAALVAYFRALRPGQNINFAVLRGGLAVNVALVVPERQGRSRTGIFLNLVHRLFMPLFSLALGFFVAFQRPWDRLAWILLALMASFSQASAGSSLMHYVLSWEDPMRSAGIAYQAICLAGWPIAMLLFGTYFPSQSRIDRKWPWVKWVALTPVGFWGVARFLVSLTGASGLAPAPLLGLVRMLNPWVFVLFSIPISLFFMQLGEKSGTLPSIDARRRLRFIWIGASVSLGPMFLINLYAFIRGGEMERLPEWIVIPVLLLEFLFPVTLAYVIVVQRAMEVRMALRQGVQYTLARGGVAAIRAILIVGVILVTFIESQNASLGRARLLTLIAGSVAVVFGVRGLLEKLSQWVDRRFFREAYNSEQILAELSEQVRTMVETGPLLQTVAARVSESLHVPKMAMLLRDGDGYRPAYSQGFADPPAVLFPEQSLTVSKLRAEDRPLAVYNEDPTSWTHTLESSEAGQLARLEPELVLPLAVKGKLHGFISLGRKQSEEPYSRSDVRLLQSVAVQTGLALENAHLTEAIASEVAQRERLNRDLEIAREVQQRLFPQKFPEVEGMAYAGACRPAQGVGGDYYDFIQVPDGHFGIAIGDVSGKGIPAALLMASLQASLRGQAINAPADLAALMTNMNRLIFEASPSNRYATFFYSEYEPRTRRLIYVNAGHNAPMVLRGSEVIRLEAGGPVVGLFAAGRYSQAEIELNAGDVVVGFTDGISEAMNAAEDEFGEERLIPVVQQNRNRPAAEIIDCLFAAADEFAAGAPQHDDMTAVVLKVL